MDKNSVRTSAKRALHSPRTSLRPQLRLDPKTRSRAGKTPFTAYGTKYTILGCYEPVLFLAIYTATEPPRCKTQFLTSPRKFVLKVLYFSLLQCFPELILVTKPQLKSFSLYLNVWKCESPCYLMVYSAGVG